MYLSNLLKLIKHITIIINQNTGSANTYAM
jgi:hypothetical protein